MCVDFSDVKQRSEACCVPYSRPLSSPHLQPSLCLLKTTTDILDVYKANVNNCLLVTKKATEKEGCVKKIAADEVIVVFL